jgi:hypothetical protein
MPTMLATATPVERQANVYCPMCTHTVTAKVVRGQSLRSLRPTLTVKPGQKCQRCHSSIDAGVIMRLLEAA